MTRMNRLSELNGTEHNISEEKETKGRGGRKGEVGSKDKK